MVRHKRFTFELANRHSFSKGFHSLLPVRGILTAGALFQRTQGPLEFHLIYEQDERPFRVIRLPIHIYFCECVLVVLEVVDGNGLIAKGTNEPKRNTTKHPF